MKTQKSAEVTDWDADRAPQRLVPWLNQVRAFSERSLREVSGSMTMVFWVLGFPAGMYLLYTSQRPGAPAALDATISIGIAVLGAMFVCLYLFGNQLVLDVEENRYAAYRSMPVSPSADLSGRMLAGLVLGSGAFASALIAGIVSGASYGLRGPESILIALLGGVLTCVFWMIVAIPLVIYVENERIAEWTTTLVAMGAFVVTGFNGALPETTPLEGEILNLLPNTLPTRLLVYHLVPAENWAEIGVSPPAMPAGPEYVVLLVIYALVALVLGVTLVNRSLYGRGWWP